jgi:hypothetical protein
VGQVPDLPPYKAFKFWQVGNLPHKMKLDPAALRRQYSNLSDEALLSMNRGDLVELAQQIYDEEVESRGLASPAASPASEIVTTEGEASEEMVEAATYTSRSEARLAKSFLVSAEIPCELENEFTLQEVELRLLVPANLLDQALEVLGAEISDEELAAQAEAAGEADPPE